MCIHIYTYIYRYILICICICICIHIYIGMYMYIYICIYTHIFDVMSAAIRFYSVPFATICRYSTLLGAIRCYPPLFVGICRYIYCSIRHYSALFAMVRRHFRSIPFKIGPIDGNLRYAFVRSHRSRFVCCNAAIKADGLDEDFARVYPHMIYAEKAGVMLDLFSWDPR